MTQNKITPLDELRQEKEIVKREVAESEARLSEHWSYVSENAVPIILDGAVNGVARYFGFGGRLISKNEKSEEDTGSTGIFQNVFGLFSAYYPLVWEIVQPMLFRYAMKKIKSLFTRKKKKRKDDDD